MHGCQQFIYAKQSDLTTIILTQKKVLDNDDKKIAGKEVDVPYP
jgi:hypothetical protein